MAERVLTDARVTLTAQTRATGRRRGLPPVLDRETRVLILGSFPGEASLAAGQYYAHPRNHFWPLLEAILGVPLVAVPYEARLACLRGHRVGVWDTIVACVRPGSLDSAIRAATRAETARVRRLAPQVELVCFNGKTAARAIPVWEAAGYRSCQLPSSSPAYTRPLAEKLAAWRVIGESLTRGAAPVARRCMMLPQQVP
jgi:hypoxanthine-DNA glycosylase